MINKAIEMIDTQIQENRDNSLIQEIGSALKNLCQDTHTAEIIAQDLEVKEMSLKHCYDKFYEYAKKNKSGNCFAGSANLAEKLIRDFYGLHNNAIPVQQAASTTKFSLADFM